VPRVRSLSVVLAIVAAITAVVVVNALLLGYGSERNDRVGKLSPGAGLPVTPAPVVTVPATTTTDDGRDHHEGGRDD
jgi:hypothetical protein